MSAWFFHFSSPELITIVSCGTNASSRFVSLANQALQTSSRTLRSFARLSGLAAQPDTISIASAPTTAILIRITRRIFFLPKSHRSTQPGTVQDATKYRGDPNRLEREVPLRTVAQSVHEFAPDLRLWYSASNTAPADAENTE